MIDPVSLILTALAAGAGIIGQEAVSEVTKDAYQKLKALIQHRLADKPQAEIILQKHEENPEIWKEPLRQELIDIQASQDNEIIRAAQQLMTIINPQQAGMGKFNVQITGDVQGFVQGDNTQVTMNFNESTDKPKQ